MAAEGTNMQHWCMPLMVPGLQSLDWMNVRVVGETCVPKKENDCS